ncbi:MAG: undecaprenyl-diphosphate phosphatase [Deferrisomatales bacterium]|nr:undecaprenyl-diphosphate phosphatase [Deferrisomatales bacterium]
MGGVEGALLGLIQGLTEFLPVSSSGHLVLAQSLIPSFHQPGVLFDTLLHLATLFAVLVFFRRDVWNLLASLGPGGDAGSRRVVALLLLATIPTGLIGVGFKDALEALFHEPRAAAAMLLVTGAVLWLSELRRHRPLGLAEIGVPRSLAVGLAQGLAIIPGISRSGSTIAIATLLGVRGEDAARFSFLLSIPAICGAVVLQVGEISEVPAGAGVPYLLGALVAFVSGLLAIRLLMQVIRARRFRWFAVYCWALGSAYLLFAS